VNIFFSLFHCQDSIFGIEVHGDRFKVLILLIRPSIRSDRRRCSTRSEFG